MVVRCVQSCLGLCQGSPAPLRGLCTVSTSPGASDCIHKGEIKKCAYPSYLTEEL